MRLRPPKPAAGRARRNDIRARDEATYIRAALRAGAARLAGSGAGAVGATSLVGVAAAIVTRHDIYARQAGVWSSLKREAGMSLSGEHRA